MKRIVHIVIFASLALSFWGCEKTLKRDKDLILFGMESIGVSTKAALNQSDVDGGPVYVFGKRNNTTDVYSATPITKNPSNGIWYPSSSQQRTWNPGSYVFRGVASSSTISSISTNVNSSGSTLPTPGIEVFNSGLSFRVNQPVTYNESGMIDFLLSRVYNVADGNTRPLVKLQLQHSMPAVEIYVIKAEAMYGACIDTISLTGIYSSGTMTCGSPLSYGTVGLHEWSTSLSGGRTASYKISGTLADRVEITDDISTTSAKIKIITMPQQLSEDATLTIKYWINERTADSPTDNYVHYSETFLLYSNVPQVWRSGHKIIYTLKVDSGIHLTGTIAPWRDIDYVEGTILPAV